MNENIVLNTPKGQLSIELLHREAPLASRRFIDQCRANVWSAAQFCKVEPLAVHCEAATQDSHSDTLERNPRIRFNRRGMVAYSAGTSSELVFCRGAGAGPPPIVGTIFGCLTPDSVYVLESIANGPKEGNALKYPVGITAAVAGVIDPPNQEHRAEPEPKGSEPKRRRIKIQLREESDEDELPKPNTKTTNAPATAKSKEAHRLNETDQSFKQSEMSQELRGVLDFERRWRVYNDSQKV